MILVCCVSSKEERLKEACLDCLWMMICTVKDSGYEIFYIEYQKHLEYSRAVQACDCEVIVG